LGRKFDRGPEEIKKRKRRRRGDGPPGKKEGEGGEFEVCFFFKSIVNNFSNRFKSNLLHLFTTFFTNYFKDF
jgi:hypothetical protein